MRPVIEAGILTAIEQRVAAARGTERPAHPVLVEGRAVGFVDDARCARLAAFHDVFARTGKGVEVLPRWRTCDARTAALAVVTQALAQEGELTAWRDERYAVAAAADAAPAFLLERAAARYFGVRTHAAHANGLVGSGAHARMWLARRSPTKAIDPGQLDNLVGGGITAGETPLATLVREAWEEAGIVSALASQARPAGVVDIERIVPDGFQRETIHAYDLALPPDFVPANQDGEVVEHRLLALDAVARLLALRAGPDLVTLDATCVALACLRRQVLTPPRARPRA